MKCAAIYVLLCGCADLIGITDERQLSIVEIGVSAGTLDPPFDPAITVYDVVVGHGTSEFEIHAEANDPQATILIGGTQSATGTLGVAVPIGDTVVDVVARTPSDVVVTYRVKVHRADIAIGFAAPRSIQTSAPGMISQIRAIDFDGDGTQDLGYATFSDLGIMNNDGNAQFTQKSMQPFPAMRSFTARDLDGDAKPDMVVTAGQVLVARGLGGGQFDAAYAAGGGLSNPGAFAFVQLDGNGIIDLVVAEPNGRIAAFTGTGTAAGFAPHPAMDSYPTPSMHTVVVAGSIDDNPGEDVATIDPMFGKIFVLRNLGTALAFEAIPMAPGARPVELILVDVDADGRDELAWIDRQTNDVVIQPFPGPARPPIRIDGTPRLLTSTDVDGDGSVDLLVLEDKGITVLLNDGAGAFTLKSIAMPMPGVSHLVAGDFDGDGRADLLTSNFTSTVLVHMGTP